MNNGNKFLAVILLLLIIFITFNNKSLKDIFSTNPASTATQDIQINKEESAKPPSAPVQAPNGPQKHGKDYISLQHESGGLWTDVYANLDYRLELITDDYLFINTPGQAKVQLTAFNYKTGKEYVILNRSNNSAEGINQVIQINNTIFFSTNAYLRPSYAYYIDLPIEQSTTTKIEGLGTNSTIKKVSGRYVIVEGDGDSCSYGGVYLLFNPKTKQAQKFAEYGYSCGEGNSIEIVGDRLLNYYTHASTEGNDIYARITYFDFGISDIPKEIDLISEEQMPAYISRVDYDAKTDSLLLGGKDKYVFNIKTGELKKSDFIIPKSVQGSISETEERKQKLKSLELPKSFRFVFGDE